jgi:hypothetical protein
MVPSPCPCGAERHANRVQNFHGILHDFLSRLHNSDMWVFLQAASSFIHAASGQFRLHPADALIAFMAATRGLPRRDTARTVS